MFAHTSSRLTRDDKTSQNEKRARGGLLAREEIAASNVLFLIVVGMVEMADFASWAAIVHKLEEVGGMAAVRC